MNRRSFLRTTSATAGAIAIGSTLAKGTQAQTAESRSTFRRPKVILPVPTPQAKYQHAQPGVPDTQLTREANRDVEMVQARPGPRLSDLGRCPSVRQ